MGRGIEDFAPTPEQLEAAEKLRSDAPRIVLPTGYLSPSQVGCYQRCPHQYYFRYILKKRTPPGALMAQGTACHKGAEVTNHHIVDHGVPASNELVTSAYSDSYEEGAAAIEDWGDIDRGVAKDQGITLITKYNEEFAPDVKPYVAPDGTRGIEEKIEVDVNGIPMLGFIDLVDANDLTGFSAAELALIQDNGLTPPPELLRSVVDYKTKAKKATKVELDGSLQFTFYSYAKKIPRVRMDMFLRLKKPKVLQATTLRTEADYQWMFMIIDGVSRAISAGVFPPCDPTAWCCSARWCGYWFDCRGKVLASR